MNSDHIRLRFGSYGVEVITQNSQQRLANLYSDHVSGRVCRTLALTHFLLPLAAELEQSDALIRNGASIGATLRADDWQLSKSDLSLGYAHCGQHFERLTSGEVQRGTPIAVQVYALSAARNNARYAYAIIAEAFHPDHVVKESHSEAIDQLHERLGEPLAVALGQLKYYLEHPPEDGNH